MLGVQCSAPTQPTRPRRPGKEALLSLRTRIQTLSAAAMLALAVASLTVGGADAKPKRPANGTTCSVPGAAVDPPSENDFEFYLPGEVVSVVKPNGDIVLIQCQADGT